MDPNDTNSPSPITTTTITTTNTTSATNEKTSINTSPSTSTKPTSKSATEDKTMETSKTDSASTDSAMTSNTNSEDKTMHTSNTDSASTTTSNVDPSNTSSSSATSTKDSNKTSADKSIDSTSQNDNADGSNSTKKVDDPKENKGTDDDNDDEDDDDDDDEEEDEDGSGEPRLFSSPPQGLSKVVDSVSDFAAKVKSGRSRHSKMIDTDVTENAGDILFETEDESSLAPVFVTHPSMIQFFAPGEPFALVCAAESPAAAGGEVRYSWTRNGRLMDMADAAARRVFRENAAANGNLIFVSPGTGDVGTYTCLAENEHGKTYSRGSVVMVRKEEEESEGPKKEIEASNNEAVGEREPRKEGVFLVYPTVVDEAVAQIVEDAGTGIADSIEE